MDTRFDAVLGFPPRASSRVVPLTAAAPCQPDDANQGAGAQGVRSHRHALANDRSDDFAKVLARCREDGANVVARSSTSAPAPPLTKTGS